MNNKKKILSAAFGISFIVAISGGVSAAEEAENPIHISVHEDGTQISIIGGADGPTSIFLAGKLGEEETEEIFDEAECEEIWYQVVEEFQKEKKNSDLPEYTLHWNRNMSGEEQEGTLWVRFTEVNDELAEDTKKKEQLLFLGDQMCKVCEDIEKVQFSWSYHSENAKSAYGTKTIDQMGISR